MLYFKKDNKLRVLNPKTEKNLIRPTKKDGYKEIEKTEFEKLRGEK